MAAPARLFDEVMHLPMGDRAQLALELLRSLDEEADADADAAWAAEIELRSADVAAGTAPTMTLDDYRAHVQRRRAARAP